MCEHLIAQIWDIKNDYQQSAYSKHIENTLIVNEMPADSPITDFSYWNGFSLIEIENNGYIDPQRAVLTFLELNTTPEMMIK